MAETLVIDWLGVIQVRMNHGLKINGNILEITLPEEVHIDKVLVNRQIFSQRMQVCKSCKYHGLEGHEEPCVSCEVGNSNYVVIEAEGLDEQIRCEMCRNPMHTNRGCDGNCKYDEKLYERIMQILGERIKPSPSVELEERTEERTETHACDCISRQDAIDAVNVYLGLSAVSRTIQNMTSIQEILENLPSAEPERKKGNEKK